MTETKDKISIANDKLRQWCHFSLNVDEVFNI